ncbi:hypothetical protein HUJ05_009431 [Dendroctonus ponderosae]|nr:hypothetical protein HUJ05_009431 [Dendroctonus ponderosae]
MRVCITDYQTLQPQTENILETAIKTLGPAHATADRLCPADAIRSLTREELAWSARSTVDVNVSTSGAGGLLLDTGNGPSFLPLPPQVLQQVAQNNSEPGVTTLKLPDLNYSRPADLPAREVDIELCFVCKKCRMAYPSDSALLAHQRQCYGPNQDSRGTFRIVQTGYECRPCNNGEKFKTLIDMQGHVQSEAHQRHMTGSESSLSQEIEDVVNQITLLATRAAQEAPQGHILDSNSNGFCQPAEPKRRFLSPTHALTSAGH